jgi:hypothetical protein
MMLFAPTAFQALLDDGYAVCAPRKPQHREDGTSVLRLTLRSTRAPCRSVVRFAFVIPRR